MKSEDDLESYFKYELAPFPPSLFDDSMRLRKGNKAAVAKILEAEAECKETVPAQSFFVIDGGHLLHKVVWPTECTFGHLYEIYFKYIIKHYGFNAVVVFDGYNSPSTKDHEHLRRSKSVTPNIKFSFSTPVTTKQTDFLTNNNNKKLFIDQLKLYLQEKEIVALQARNDADILIVDTAISQSKNKDSTVVVGDDTDLLVLLVGKQFLHKNMYMLKPGNSRVPDKVFDINLIQKKLGPIRETLLILHALSGCDTTSYPYRKGKKTIFNCLRKNVDLNKQLILFNNENANKQDLVKLGIKFFLCIYGCKSDDIDIERFFLFKKIISRQNLNKNFDLAVLPPTSKAIEQHVYRVYFQVQTWLNKEINSSDWGWELKNDITKPVPTSLSIVPDNILKLLYCNCKNDCNKNCPCNYTKCSDMCSNCRGISCVNSNTLIITDSDIEDEN